MEKITIIVFRKAVIIMIATARFSLHMLRKQKHQALFYVFSCTFAVLIMFILLHIIYNPDLAGGAYMTWESYNKIFSVMLAFLSMAFVVAMAFYAYNFYLENQTNELGIFMLSGSKFSRIFWYLLVQNVVIFGFAMVLGLGLGFAVLPLVYLFINWFCHLDMPLFRYNLTAMMAVVLICLLLIVYLAMVATGFVYRHDINNLLGMNQEAEKKDTRVIKLPLIFYVIVFLSPLVALFQRWDPGSFGIVGFAALLAGFPGICHKVLPAVMRKLERKAFLTRKIALVAAGHFSQLVSGLATMLTVFAMICLLMNSMLLTNLQNAQNTALVLVNYAALLISAGMSVIYKLLLETDHRKQEFRHLYQLGYQVSDLKKMIVLEMAWLFGVLAVTLLLYAGLPALLVPGMRLMSNAILILALLVISLVSCRAYQNRVLKEIRQ